MLILGAMLCKIILMFANVPYCAAICPVAVAKEQNIVCQMRVKPGRHINLNSAMQARNLPDSILALGYEVQGSASMVLQPFGTTVDLKQETLGQEENPPVVFEEHVVASMQMHLP